MAAVVVLALGVGAALLVSGTGTDPAAPSGTGGDATASGTGPVTYEVTGSGTAIVTYSVGATEPATTGAVPLPFRVTVPAGAEPSVYTVVARGPVDQSGTLSCSVGRAGDVLDRRDADGPSATVTCSGS